MDTITYRTPTGTCSVAYDRGADSPWVVTDDDTRRFASVPHWMAYVRETHGWPLEVESSDIARVIG